MNDIGIANLSMIKPLTQSNHSINNLTNSHKSKMGSTKTLKTHTSNTEVAKIPPFYPASTQMSSKSLKKSIAENNLIHNDHNEKEKATLYSTWTPLSDEKSNHKLFEERKQLFTKWFETWNDSQRKIAIEEILNICKPKQLFFTRDTLNKIAPVYHVDFTRTLPRVICLYIMSFLDPRSLCRAAQVCWYWKMISESDQLWMPKCLRFGWNLNYIPSTFEHGIWKQFYIENIKALQYVPIKSAVTPAATERSEVNLHDLSYGRFGFSRFIKNSKAGNKSSMQANKDLKQPPWRANNSNPNHFYRFNYLDNNEDESSENVANKRKDRVLKTVPLDSLSKKHSLSHSNLKSISLNNDDLAHENNLNQSKIESLVAKGQILMNQLNNTELEKINKSLFQTSERTQTDLFNVSSANSKTNSALMMGSKKTGGAWTLLDDTNDI